MYKSLRLLAIIKCFVHKEHLMLSDQDTMKASYQLSLGLN